MARNLSETRADCLGVKLASRLFIKKPYQLFLEEMRGENRLRRILGPISLSSLGIGSTIGTGIFVLTGLAVHDKAGPALILSYVVSGIACVFAALSYAELASMVPVAGSTYTYSYATLGELFAWIIGWDLVLEYAVAAATVANGWSQYLASFLSAFQVTLPKIISMAPFHYDPALGHLVATGTVMDLPAIIVTLLLTILLVIGIRESAGANNVMVGIKVVVILLVIVVGAFYINPANWRPFAPFGYTGLSFFGKTLWGQTGAEGPLGMLAGASIVFFSYIGFESVSTHAEEAKNPQRDVPIGLIASLIVCTVLYIGVAVVLTGMVPASKMNVDAPVADAFKQVGLGWAQFIISIAALAGITSVLLVTILSQARILLAIAQTACCPPAFLVRSILNSARPGGHHRDRSVCGHPGRFHPAAGFGGTREHRHPARFRDRVHLRDRHAQAPPGGQAAVSDPGMPYVPILGAAFCLLLMFSLPPENWLRLLGWLLIGFVIYFGYGRRHSKLAKMTFGGK